jgi:hypothetical protein
MQDIGLMEFTDTASRTQALFGDLVAASSVPPALEAPPSTSPASAQAVAFLQQLDPDGWHQLAAFDPSRDRGAPVNVQTFPPGAFDDMRRWVDDRDGRLNLYFSANEPRANSPNQKLTKEDIGAIRAVYADIDLPAGADIAKGLRDLQKPLDGLELGPTPPTFRIDSGGGIQLIWKLDRKYPADQYREWAEGQGLAIAKLVEGDKIHNIDRFLRLPGTVNVPIPSKKAKGRVERRGSILASDPSRVFSSTQLSSAWPPVSAASDVKDSSTDVMAALDAIDMGEVESHHVYADLPDALRKKFEEACRNRPWLAAVWHGHETGLRGEDRSSSAWRAALAAGLGAVGDFDAQDYANLAWTWDKAVRSKIDKRQLARDWARLAVPRAAQREATLSHFEEIEYDAPRSEEPKRDVFKTLTLADIFEMPDPVFVIDRHIPEKSLGFLYGEPGSKKSFIALDWALHLVYDREDWHGDAIRSKSDGMVLYLAGEGAAGMKKRAGAWLQHHLIAADDPRGLRFHLLPHAVNMMSADEVKKLVRTLRTSIKAPVAAVIVDTVSRAVPGADENLQKEMTRFIQSCDLIKQQFECVVVGVHHASHNGKMRGSTVLQGAGDFVFRLDVKKGALAGRLVCEKQKDSPDGWSEPYRFDVVQLGDDSSSSLVPVRAVGAGKAQFTPEVEQQILDAIAADWEAGTPWAFGKQSPDRWAPRRLHVKFGFAADEAEGIIDLLVKSKAIEVAQVDRKTKRRGYRVVDPDQADRQDVDGVFA